MANRRHEDLPFTFRVSQYELFTFLFLRFTLHVFKNVVVFNFSLFTFHVSLFTIYLSRSFK